MSFFRRLFGLPPKKEKLEWDNIVTSDTNQSVSEIADQAQKEVVEDLEVTGAELVPKLRKIDTEGKSKTKIVLEHLLEFKEEGLDKKFAKEHYNIYNLATLIQNLRKRNIKIITDLKAVQEKGSLIKVSYYKIKD